MGKFSIGEFAKSLQTAAVSNLDTSPAQVQMIPLEDILPNKGNFYALRELDPLADSIAMDGLLDPLVVTPSPDAEGKYRLISGHRRRAAIEKLLKDKEHPREDLRLVPCMVRSYKSEAMAQLQLILANSTARVLSSAETMKQAAQMELLLYQLKEEGYQFPGRMRDQVAAACKVSAPKLARLKVIREKLIPKYMVLFEKDKLPEQTAYALARLPAEFQERLASVCPEPPTGYVVERLLKNYENGWRWEPTLQCPDGKACRRGDTFLRHDAEGSYGGHMCGGLTCCLNCDEAKARCYPCERMCSKAKALRKEAKDEANAKEEARKKTLSDQYKAETQGYAQRLLRAIEAAGLTDEDTFPWDYYRTYDVATVRAYAAGQFAEGSVWSSASLAPSRCHEPAKTAQALHCSTDYLLGLTDDLFPVTVQTAQEPEAPTVEEAVSAPEDPPEADAASEDVPAGEDAAPQQPCGSGWYPAEQRPEEGQRAVVENSDDDLWLGIFHDNQWMDLDLYMIGSYHILDDVVMWMPFYLPSSQVVPIPEPPAIWRREPPKKSCHVCAKFDAGGTEIRSIAWYDAVLQKYYFAKDKASIDAQCIGWVPLPED